MRTYVNRILIILLVNASNIVEQNNKYLFSYHGLAIKQSMSSYQNVRLK